MVCPSRGTIDRRASDLQPNCPLLLVCSTGRTAFSSARSCVVLDAARVAKALFSYLPPAVHLNARSRFGNTLPRYVATNLFSGMLTSIQTQVDC